MRRNDETFSIISHAENDFFKKLYGNDSEVMKYQKERYTNLYDLFLKRFGEFADRRDLHSTFQSLKKQDFQLELVSSPGRTEIAGNHTDHQHGRVLAASVTLDCIGIAVPLPEEIIHIFNADDSSEISLPLNAEREEIPTNPSLALLFGIVQGFRKFGFKVGGFFLVETSDVIAGAGVSSSASFEMLLCKVLDKLYNGNTMSKVTYAKIGQFAEHECWHKKSGLMDQMACAIGGPIGIDFTDIENPKVEEINFDFSGENYDLLLVDTGENHADLSGEYSSIPEEMQRIAGKFGKKFLSEVEEEVFYERIHSLRADPGDRAILRAMHFFEENKRVVKVLSKLRESDFDGFLKLVSDSGNSSWKWLQNCYCGDKPHKQGMSLTLAVTERFIEQHGKGAVRVHGGGFGGSIAVYLPKELGKEYATHIRKSLAETSIHRMGIRKVGVVCASDLD